jgi:hypothetical protein
VGPAGVVDDAEDDDEEVIGDFDLNRCKPLLFLLGCCFSRSARRRVIAAAPYGKLMLPLGLVLMEEEEEESARDIIQVI